MKVCSLFLAVIFSASFAFAKKEMPRKEGLRVGDTKSISITPVFGEESLSVSNEDHLWRYEIREKGAKFIRIHFEDFNLRAGDEVVVRSATGRVVDTLTNSGPYNNRNFWALSSFGDTAYIEFSYRKPYDTRPFSIDKIVKGTRLPLRPKDEYKSFFDSLKDSHQLESLCGPNDGVGVACVEADAGKWKNVMASVGVMKVGEDASESTFCSGSLISPTDMALTNNHCINTQAQCEGAEFVFAYYHTTCGGSRLAEWVSFRCEKMVKTSPYVDCDPTVNSLDYSLNKVAGNPSSRFGYVEIDDQPLRSGEGLYIIQHPSGRPHEISQGSGADVKVDGHTLRYFDTLDTEPGSSGSPIFRESNNKLVGLHHCGGCEDAASGNRGMLMTDIRPQIQDYLCTSDLSLSIVESPTLTEVTGNGDAVLDPGETWEFLPEAKNISCSKSARNVVAKFVSTQNGITIVGGDVSFGDIASAGSAKGKNAVQFRIDRKVSCGTEIEIRISELLVDGVKNKSDIGYLKETLGEEVFVDLMAEKFNKGLPDGWKIVDEGTGTGAAQTWTTNNVGDRSISFDPPFFIVDSDQHGKYDMNEQLISREVDVSKYPNVVLTFKHDFKKYGDELGLVEVKSSATSQKWTEVARYSADDSGSKSIDISAIAGGQSDVQVRFYYYNANDAWYWAVDDVYVSANLGRICH
ncbi:MAG: trypsin-like peptidase domain-containing protein [Bdellovibrionales bacterium]|nr:trypsin-like peptidase domain-containing protein [Bdellovibrionales bacterium]